MSLCHGNWLLCQLPIDYSLGMFNKLAYVLTPLICHEK
jgi:hypothetical protein